ncbi:tobamovirus multiplication protein 1-like isoform X1 [Neltuma alba]|uniref:tobamovirus multiplication protein 1-like isoform X1 n=1 Tax=Neltuma alba TaxID=207710 RepID=UPI0010A4F2F0|nr:tobamovirus multiplication protein 1-like isoform X1 [Prosopis alba]
MTLKTKSFAFSEEGGALIEWWNEIHYCSDQRQSPVYYVLCASYALVSVAALVQLVRIQLRIPEHGWTTQKAFHLMTFLISATRAVLFGLQRSIFCIRPKALEQVLMDLPGLLFFSTFTLLVLFWAEIYSQARSLRADKLRPSYYIINGVIYFIQICIWIYMSVSKSPAGAESAKLFLAVISFFAALGFLIYGGRLFILLLRFPFESRGRVNKLYEVGSVTCICCTSFLIRCVMLAFSAFNKGADLDVLEHPILNLVYYMLVEIIPSALVLFLLRKVPSRQITDHYHYQPIIT